MSENTEHHVAERAAALNLLEIAQETLSASLRFSYFSNGKGHKQSKALLAPGSARQKGRSKHAVSGGDELIVGGQSSVSDSMTLAGDPDGGLDGHESDASADIVETSAHADGETQSAGCADITDRYLAEVSERGRLTSSEEYRLARRAGDGDEQAFRQLVEHHLGLVVMMARRYVGRGLPLLDLIEEGNLGLLTAARKFDPELGFRLSTYAKWWIREGIEMALMTQSRIVRVPVHLSRSAKQASKRLNNDAAMQGGDVSTQSLPADLIAMLDDNDRDGAQLLHELEASDDCKPEAALSQHQSKAKLRLALSGLSVKERMVIEGRFGLQRDESRTLEAIGQDLGLTYERVRQIEKAALAKLRERFAADGVTWDALL